MRKSVIRKSHCPEPLKDMNLWESNGGEKLQVGSMDPAQLVHHLNIRPDQCGQMVD